MANRIVKVILRGDIGDLQAKMRVAGASMKDAGDKITSADKASQKFRGGLSAVGSTAGKVGLVAAAGLGAIVAATANFDQAMSKVQAATHESAGNMELLRAASIKAGQDTVYSASEAAGAVESLAKAGVSTADILKGGLSGALNLAAAGGLEVADAADIAATALTQFKLQGKDVPHVADLLAAAAGKAQGDVTDMGMALKQSGLVASQMGLSIEETTGTLAAFASAGLLGSDAGTSFRTMLLRLANPSKQSAQLMEQLGISAYDAQGKFVGMKNLSGQLATALGKKTQAERDSAMATIFGSDAIRAASVLYEQGAEGVQNWTNKVNDTGYAADTAATRLDNLKGDLEQLRGSLETAFISAGEGSQGGLRSMVQGATQLVNVFNKLPGPIQSTATGFLGLTAITGGGLWFASKAIRGIADTRAALKNMNMTLRDSEGNLTRTGAAFKRLTIGAGVLAGLAALDGAMSNIDHHNPAPTVNELANALAALAAGKSKDIGKDFGDIGEAMDLVGSKSSGAVAGVEKFLGPLTKMSEAISGGLGFSDQSISTKIDDATTRIQTLDQALSAMVTSGSVDQARAAFDALAKSQGLTSDEQAQLLDMLPGYRDAIAGAAKESGNLATAEGAVGAAAGATNADLAEQQKAYEKIRDQAGETAREFFGLGKSVNDSKVSLDGWISDLEKQATALRNFTENVRKAGKRGIREGLIQELEAAGPEGAMRLQQLANASDKEIARANRAWARGQRAIDAYVSTVAGVPPGVATTLTVNSAGAEAALRRIAKEIRDVPKEWRTDYYVVQHGGVSKRPQVQDAQAHADGGTVTGQRYPYGDKVLTYLAPGEEVISNRHGEADRFRADRAAGRIPAYAGGGTVAVPAGGSAFDVDRLASLMSGDRLLGMRDSRDVLVSAFRTALRELPIVQAPQPTDLLYGAA